MADDNIDPFGEHDKTDSRPDRTGKTMPPNPRGAMGGSTWETKREQETSLGETSQKMEVLKEHVKALHKMLFEGTGQTREALHFDNFELRDGELYYKGKSKSLMIKGGKAKVDW